MLQAPGFNINFKFQKINGSTVKMVVLYMKK